MKVKVRRIKIELFVGNQMTYIGVENFNLLIDKIINQNNSTEKSNIQLRIWRMFKMLQEMMSPKIKGNTLTIDLSNFGYENYFAECAYYFDKREGKYSLSMWLNRNDMEDRMRLSSKKIDTQYISGTRETIIENICRVVHQAATVPNKGDNGRRYFDHYVERYEYELACFERGNELFEKERKRNFYNDKE